jgi:hypothetical protein
MQLRISNTLHFEVVNVPSVALAVSQTFDLVRESSWCWVLGKSAIQPKNSEPDQDEGK